MERSLVFLLVVLLSSSVKAAPHITIYNSGFAVMRDTISLSLAQGDNEVVCPPVSPFLDPASVMLRDPTGKADFRIVLQKFRADVLSEQSMLAHFEGQTIPFRIHEHEKDREVM